MMCFGITLIRYARSENIWKPNNSVLGARKPNGINRLWLHISERTDCTGSSKYNYHMITSTTSPEAFGRCIKTIILAVDILIISHVIGVKPEVKSCCPWQHLHPVPSVIVYLQSSFLIFDIFIKAIKFQNFFY
jgi:hypothetical protein